MPQNSVTSRIAELRVLLGRANRAYYADANPIMPDAEFDRLLTELAELESQHPELADANSPTQRVGGEAIAGFTQVRHARPMLSIDNTYSEADVREWYARVLRGLKIGTERGGLSAGGPFSRQSETSGQISPPRLVCDPKIDGVALSLRYERGKLVHAVTRGDGTTGDDVTHVARTIRSIPLELRANGSTPDVPEVFEVRGEAYLPLAVFDRLNRDREASGDEPFMNPRNAAAGGLKQLDPKAAALRRLAFMAHGRGEVSDARGHTRGREFATSHSDFLMAARALGLPTNPETRAAGTIEEALAVIEAFDGKRRTMDYATDGMVVRVDSFAQQDQLGTTAKSPRWVIAFKYPADRKVTRLLRVEHQVGKTGRITPRAVMEPVLIAGSMVQHATLHNYGQICKRDIRINDRIDIEKAGEVIPYVVGVAAGGRSQDATTIVPPARCPECGGPVEVEFGDLEAAGKPEDETGRFCLNPQCPAQVYEKLVWFAGRRQMDIAGLGEQTIEQIRATKGVPLGTFADIYRLCHHRDALVAIDRMGEKKVENLLAGIEASKSRGLGRLLGSLGIRHVGDTTAKLLARLFCDLDALLAANELQLRPKSLNKSEAIALGFAEATADRPETGLGKGTAGPVHAFLHSAAAREMFDDLRAVGVDLTSRDYIESTAKADLPLTGTTFVITGTLEGFEREDLKAKLESFGARVSGSVSAKTSVVIVGQSAGSKLDRARELGITIWDETKLNQELARLK